MEDLDVRLFLNREAWRPRHWLVLVACVATAKVADVAANQGWWSWVAIALFVILLSCLPHDFVGLKRRHHVAKGQESGWELLVAALILGVVALTLSVTTLSDYSETSELRAHGVIARTPGTVTVSNAEDDSQDIEVSFTTNNGSDVTGTLHQVPDHQPAVGDRISVRYSPTSPETVFMASYPMGYGHVVFGAVLSAVVWVLMAFVLRLEYRKRGSEYDEDGTDQARATG